MVEEARFVSSCFNCPSNARPLLSLLFDNNGHKQYTFDNVAPGPTGKPSLKIREMKNKTYANNYSQKVAETVLNVS